MKIYIYLAAFLLFNFQVTHLSERSSRRFYDAVSNSYLEEETRQSPPGSIIPTQVISQRILKKRPPALPKGFLEHGQNNDETIDSQREFKSCKGRPKTPHPNPQKFQPPSRDILPAQIRDNVDPIDKDFDFVETSEGHSSSKPEERNLEAMMVARSQQQLNDKVWTAARGFVNDTFSAVCRSTVTAFWSTLGCEPE